MRLSSTKRFLRMALTTKWGLYAWEDVEDFSVDNHLVNSPCSFKGRPITDSNIQVILTFYTYINKIIKSTLKLINNFSGICQRLGFQVLTPESVSMASVRHKLHATRRRNQTVLGQSTSFAVDWGTHDTSWLLAPEILTREMGLSREQLTLHQSLRRAVSLADAPSEAHRKLQQLLERVFVQQRPHRTPRNTEKANRTVSMLQNWSYCLCLDPQRIYKVLTCEQN